jgi:hypothetical protein
MLVLADPHDVAAVRLDAVVHDPETAVAPVEADGALDVRSP